MTACIGGHVAEVVGFATNLPTKAGVKTTIYIYRVAQKLYKFN